MRMTVFDAMQLAELITTKLRMNRAQMSMGMRLGRRARTPEPKFPEPKFIDPETQCMLELQWIQAVASLPRELRDELASDIDTGEIARLFLAEIAQREDSLISSISKGLSRIATTKQPK